MSRTPNYKLNAQVNISVGLHDSLVLPEGAFIRPIHIDYVPKHVLDDKRWKWFNEDKETFCYTRYGLLPIETKYIYEA